ncbi:UDP-N-acetylmuramoyl-L-alanyl-D-glutamate--2,6-diaminopimelate ligase [Candidatus Latescibacterota bacterium]
MKLNNLLRALDNVKVLGSTEVEIHSIHHDSRKVDYGSLFIAVKGFMSNGNDYITAAVQKGAAAVMTDSDIAVTDVPVVRVQDARKAMALVSDRFYGNPQDLLIMTGITGTNGKTTTSYMVKSIFEACGFSCGVIGTIRHLIGKKEIVAANTTPEAPDIHESLVGMVEAQQNACVMEISSHALKLSRVYGINFRAVAFTNITRDHLDFHGSFEQYLDAKSILFSSLSGDSTAVINMDDPQAGHIIKASRGGQVLTYGNDAGCSIRPVSSELTPHGSKFVLTTPPGRINVSLSIPGRFNISNAMAAAGIGIACGLPTDIIAEGLSSLKSVRGRYETIDEGQDFSVIIDYAHTPDALERILSSVKELMTGKLISVYGCGGDRDKGKRPIMGEISARIADISVITSDNPRTEDPLVILHEILEGVPSGTVHEVIPDRAEAIDRALELAGKGDAVVIAGKGHEDYQIINGEKLHFDDAEIARPYLRTKK